MAKKRNGEPEKQSYREIYARIREEIRDFSDGLVEFYVNYEGNDWRKEIAHLLEQFGYRIRSQVEKEKRLARLAEREVDNRTESDV